MLKVGLELNLNAVRLSLLEVKRVNIEMGVENGSALLTSALYRKLLSSVTLYTNRFKIAPKTHLYSFHQPDPLGKTVDSTRL